MSQVVGSSQSLVVKSKPCHVSPHLSTQEGKGYISILNHPVVHTGRGMVWGFFSNVKLLHFHISGLLSHFTHLVTTVIVCGLCVLPHVSQQHLKASCVDCSHCHCIDTVCGLL